MTLRDIGWALGGFWACIALGVLTLWWHDQKSGVGQVKEVPAALSQAMGHVEVATNYFEQIKTANKISDELYIKKWASFEKRLKQLEIQLATQIEAINQYKRQQEIMVAQQPKTPLPAPQLVKLAREMGFTQVRVVE